VGVLADQILFSFRTRLPDDVWSTGALSLSGVIGSSVCWLTAVRARSPGQAGKEKEGGKKRGSEEEAKRHGGIRHILDLGINEIPVYPWI
jgi:hypothetical protein